MTKPALTKVTGTPTGGTLDPTERQKMWAEIWLPTMALIGVLIVMIISLMAYLDSISRVKAIPDRHNSQFTLVLI